VPHPVQNKSMAEVKLITGDGERRADHDSGLQGPHKDPKAGEDRHLVSLW